VGPPPKPVPPTNLVVEALSFFPAVVVHPRTVRVGNPSYVRDPLVHTAATTRMEDRADKFEKGTPMTSQLIVYTTTSFALEVIPWDLPSI